MLAGAWDRLRSVATRSQSAKPLSFREKLQKYRQSTKRERKAAREVQLEQMQPTPCPVDQTTCLELQRNTGDEYEPVQQRRSSPSNNAENTTIFVERCRDEDKRVQQGKPSLSNTSLSSHALHHVQSRHGDGALGGISANTGKTIDLTARLAWLDALEQFAKMQVERKDLDAPNVGSHDSILAECEDSPSRQRRAQLSAAYSGDVLTLRERKQELLTGDAS